MFGPRTYTKTGESAIFDAHTQPHRYGKSKRRNAAVSLISREAREREEIQTQVLTDLLFQIRPQLSKGRQVAIELKREHGLEDANTQTAFNAYKLNR